MRFFGFSIFYDYRIQVMYCRMELLQMKVDVCQGHLWKLVAFSLLWPSMCLLSWNVKTILFCNIAQCNWTAHVVRLHRDAPLQSENKEKASKSLISTREQCETGASFDPNCSLDQQFANGICCSTPFPSRTSLLRWSRWTEFADLALAGREIEARGGQAWQPPLSRSPSLLTLSCQLIKAYKWHISSAVFASTPNPS